MAESDSKSSSDETDRSDQNVDLGPGRSYECAFCKRGFTTAQALGGHMNIHRKDRRKPIIRPDYTVNNHPLVSSKSVDHQENNYTSFRSFVAIQSYPPVHFSRSSDPDHHHHHQVHLKPYQTYINPATTNWGTPTTATPVLQDHNNPNYNDMLRRNWRGSSILSLGIGMSHREQDDQEDDDHDKGTISGDLHGGDHVEVDLELRLGYDP